MKCLVSTKRRRSSLTRMFIWGLLLSSACLDETWGTQSVLRTNPGAFDVADYRKLLDIQELAISTDGEYVAFLETSHCYDACGRSGKVYVLATRGDGVPQYVEGFDGADELAWKPKSHVLAALMSRNGQSGVYSYSILSHRVRLLTDSSTSVVYFEYAPNGTLAYMAKKSSRTSREATIYWLARYGRHGILVNPDTTGIGSFRDPTIDSEMQQKWITPNTLRVGGGKLPTVSMSVPGSVRSFVWSPDSSKIAVTYVAAKESPAVAGLGSYFRSLETSVGIVNVRSGEFKVVASGGDASGGRPATWYATGAWTRDGQRIVLLRFGKEDPPTGSYYAHWEIVDPFHAFGELKQDQSSTLELPYPIDEAMPSAATLLMPEGGDTVLVEAPVYGRYNLYAFGRHEETPSARIRFNGDVREVASSADGRVVAFVGQDITNPPEVYLLNDGHRVVRLTALNTAVQHKARYKGMLVRWLGSDGSRLSGWLLEPKDTPGPWPLLTLVHGGPKYPMTDSFAKFFANWPFPVEALASHGIAVFEPNYRSTTGFGWKFAAPKPSEVPQMAVLDVILGIAHLEETGIADPMRLGICGQSYGDWVGALVMERFRGFVAASLAEGSGDEVIDYSVLPGDFVRYAWDPVQGSYYRNPLAYLEQSPDLHVQGISTALMLGSGAYSELELGLTLGKAARYSGEPVEWVVYPHTQHTIADPSLLQEVARREFAWFEFWLRGAVEADMVSDRELRTWERWRMARTGAP